MKGRCVRSQTDNWGQLWAKIQQHEIKHPKTTLNGIKHKKTKWEKNTNLQYYEPVFFIYKKGVVFEDIWNL